MLLPQGRYKLRPSRNLINLSVGNILGRMDYWGPNATRGKQASYTRNSTWVGLSTASPDTTQLP